MRISFFLIAASLALPAYADPHKAECYPKAEYASQWPVDAIYLHGLFTANPADTNGWRALETNNRNQLKALADKLKIRIAIPVAPIGIKNTRNWNSTSLAQIEAAAQKACGGVPLAKPRALIGFSNGGYRVRAIARQACGQQKDYTKILSIGAPNGSGPAACGNLVNKDPHVMPDLDYFKTHLSSFARRATLSPSGGSAPPANR